MKPEVTAPGVAVDSALIGSGTEAAYESGTSMATPHTAGEALLVKQAHPGWGNVKFWKDAIVNTANPLGVAGFRNRGAGAGLIQAWDATHTNVVAGGYPDGMASLNFRVPNIKSDYTKSHSIRLRNFGNSPATFQLGRTASQGASHGIKFMVGGHFGSTVTVPAHGSTNVRVVLHVPIGSAVSPFDAFLDFAYLGAFADIGGLVTLTPIDQTSNGGIGLTVAYYAVPTATSSVKVDINTKQLLKKGTTKATVTNPKGGATGFADWFSWGGSSPVSPDDIGAADLIKVGVQSFPAYAFAEFAIKVKKPWSNPATDEFDVLVDVDGDTIPDYDVVTYDYGALTGSADHVAVTFVYSFATDDIDFRGYLSGAMFNGTTMELPVDWGQLCQSGSPCISPGTPISYVVASYDRNGGSDMIGEIDPGFHITSSAAPFNLFYPTFDNGTDYPSGDIVDPGASVLDQVNLDQASETSWPQIGLLIFAQNNRGTSWLNRPEAIGVGFPAP